MGIGGRQVVNSRDMCILEVAGKDGADMVGGCHE